MRNGWTGGQFSVLRALFGASLPFLLVDCRDPERAFLLPVLALASLALAVGLWTRAAALVALATWLLAYGHCRFAFWLVLPVAAALAFCVLLPPRPYGAWSARGRPDPGGGWSVAPGLLLGLWCAFGLILLALCGLFHPWLSAVLRSFDLVGLFLAFLFLFDPGWIRGRGRGVDRVFYDGHCGLCHGTVRFLLAEDREASFRFAPLQGPTFAELVPAAERATLPDSVIVVRADGERLVRSAGMFHLLRRLGGVWRILGTVLALVPSALCDAGYDAVARVRKRVFGTREEACPLLTPEFTARFDP